jgi:hypothetical protein
MGKVYNWAKGIFFDRRQGAPDFVVGRMSFKVEDAVPWLQENQNERGYVNTQITVKKSGDGWNVSLDDWQPQQRQPSQPSAESQPPAGDDIPF